MALKIDFLETYDCDGVAAELRRIAAMLGKSTLTTAEIDLYGRVSSECVTKKFGSIYSALLAAGLTPIRGRSWTDAELLRMLVDLWEVTQRDHGRSPRMADFQQHRMPVTPWTIAGRFGGWRKALLAASRLSASGQMPSSPPVPRRGSMSVRTRFLVFQRDLYTCRICRKMGVQLEVDHIVPVSRGGSNDLDNLQTLCVPCNRGKSDSLQ